MSQQGIEVEGIGKILSDFNQLVAENDDRYEAIKTLLKQSRNVLIDPGALTLEIEETYSKQSQEITNAVTELRKLNDRQTKVSTVLNNLSAIRNKISDIHSDLIRLSKKLIWQIRMSTKSLTAQAKLLSLKGMALPKSWHKVTAEDIESWNRISDKNISHFKSLKKSIQEKMQHEDELKAKIVSKIPEIILSQAEATHPDYDSYEMTVNLDIKSLQSYLSVPQSEVGKLLLHLSPIIDAIQIGRETHKITPEESVEDGNES